MKKEMQKEEVSTKKPKAKDVRIDSAKKINTKSKMENAEETSNFKDLSCQRLRHKNGRFRADRPADPEAAGKKPSPDCRTKREEMQNIICCFSTLSGRFSAGIEAGHRENAPAARTL